MTISRPRTSPWGQVDHVDVALDGHIYMVSTPSHGGIKLSGHYNAKIPLALRRSDGWYEEDCDAHSVIRTFPQHFTSIYPHLTADELRDMADEGIRDWMPDEYEAAFGVTLTDDQSYMRRRRKELQAN